MNPLTPTHLVFYSFKANYTNKRTSFMCDDIKEVVVNKGTFAAIE